MNGKFASNRRSIAVPLMEAKKNIFSNNDSKAIASSMESDRQLLIDSAVVRIMKSRKTASFPDILSEVTRQLSNRFVPDMQVCNHLYPFDAVRFPFR